MERLSSQHKSVNKPGWTHPLIKYKVGLQPSCLHLPCMRTNDLEKACTKAAFSSFPFLLLSPSPVAPRQSWRETEEADKGTCTWLRLAVWRKHCHCHPDFLLKHARPCLIRCLSTFPNPPLPFSLTPPPSHTGVLANTLVAVSDSILLLKQASIPRFGALALTTAWHALPQLLFIWPLHRASSLRPAPPRVFKDMSYFTNLFLSLSLSWM